MTTCHIFRFLFLCYTLINGQILQAERLPVRQTGSFLQSIRQEWDARRRVGNSMKKRGFRYRIIMAMVLVAMLCIAVIETVSYYVQQDEIVNNYLTTVQSKAKLQLNHFESLMQTMYMELNGINCSDALQEAITEYTTSDRSYDDELQFSRSLQELLPNMDYDCHLYLYLTDEEAMFTSRSSYSRIELNRANLFTWKNRSDNPFAPLFYMNYFTDSAEYVFGYAQAVTDSLGQEIGQIGLTIEERSLYYDTINILNHNDDGEVYYLVNERGVVCCSEEVSELDILQRELKSEKANSYAAWTMEDGSVLLLTRSANLGYAIVCRSDMSQPREALRYLLYSIVGLMAAVAGGLVLASWLITYRLYSPMEALLQTITRVQEGALEARVPMAEMYDEFEILGENFNDMLDHMDELMNNVVAERMERREAEVNALQYQIRPHFMYNTLNSIRFAATLQKNQQLAELLGNFINLLEASIQRKGAFITLADEIRLVQDFLALQSFRYMDCFTCEFDVRPSAADCYVPCLLLQPMVENAVFHGIDTTSNDNVLTIQAWIHRKQLQIRIHDNGKGFVQDDRADDKRRLTGIGLENVRQRLELYYGKEAHFSIRSAEGEGTAVRISLPVSYDPEEYMINKNGGER